MHMLVQSIHGRSWYFNFIYANPNLGNKKVLWEDLKEISINMKDHWLLACGLK